MTLLPRHLITTERVVLEPISRSHAPGIYAAIEASTEYLAAFMGWVENASFESTMANLAESEAAWLRGAEYRFAIIVDGLPVGNVGLRVTANDPTEANIGYWLSAAQAGRGYMTEALAALVEFGFRTVGLGRQELRTHVDNVASQRVAEKVGMGREGRVRGGTWLGSRGSQDAYLYGMIASDPRRDTGRTGDARPEGVPAISEPDFSRGLITAVAQDELDGAVLMVAHMDEEAYRQTLSSGHAWFWSRSRDKLWKKGETSGHFLEVRSVSLDCDGDAVLLRVAPTGPACHTGARTCFHNPV